MTVRIDNPKTLPSRWRWAIRGAVALALVIGAYLAVAYLVLPAVWKHHERHPALSGAPRTTVTAEGIPGDPINIALVGTQTEVVQAMLSAGWLPADPTTLHTAGRIVEDVMLNRPYPDAPVSNLYVWGKKQDLAFEQPSSHSPKQRHHVRFWSSQQTDANGRPLWLGAATYDMSVELSHRNGQITHRIAPDVDAERDKIVSDLAQAGWLAEQSRAAGIGPTQSGRNGGGDRYVTDGDLIVCVLGRMEGSR